jgi:hypothetical protein
MLELVILVYLYKKKLKILELIVPVFLYVRLDTFRLNKSGQARADYLT